MTLEPIYIKTPDGEDKYVGNFDPVSLTYYRLKGDFLRVLGVYAIATEAVYKLKERGCKFVSIPDAGFETDFSNFIEHGEPIKYPKYEAQTGVVLSRWRPIENNA